MMNNKLIANKAKMTPKEREFQILFNNARIAGLTAVAITTPTPMIVSQHSNPANDNSPVERAWYVSGGVCGFASIIIRPGTSHAAHFAKKYLGARKAYYGGMEIWVGEFGQSMELKEAYAHAFAGVLNAAGIKAYSTSRMD